VSGLTLSHETKELNGRTKGEKKKKGKSKKKNSNSRKWGLKRPKKKKDLKNERRRNKWAGKIRLWVWHTPVISIHC